MSLSQPESESSYVASQHLGKGKVLYSDKNHVDILLDPVHSNRPKHSVRRELFHDKDRKHSETEESEALSTSKPTIEQTSYDRTETQTQTDAAFGETLLNNFRDTQPSNDFDDIMDTTGRYLTRGSRAESVYLRLTDYLLSDNVMDMVQNPFNGCQYVNFLAHRYLYMNHMEHKQRLVNENKIASIHVPTHFEIFPFPFNSNSIDLVENKRGQRRLRVSFQSDEFIANMLTYLHNISYGYTLFAPGYSLREPDGSSANHSVSTVMMRLKNEIHVVMIDNNNNTPHPSSRADITELGEKLIRMFSQRSKRLVQKTHQNVTWSLHVCDTYEINVVGHKNDRFSLTGYCQLAAYFILDCIYRNLMIHDSLSTLHDRSDKFIVPYFTRILQHIHHTFQIDRSPHKMYVFTSNYTYRLLQVLYYENEDQSLEQKFFDIVSLPSIPAANFPGDFKYAIWHYVLANKYFCRCMGFEFNGTRHQDFFVTPQKNNSVEYYIAELFVDVNRPYMEFKSVTRQQKIKIPSNHSKLIVTEIKSKNKPRNVPVDTVNIVFFKIRDIVVFCSRSLPKNDLNYALPAYILPPPPPPPAIPNHLMPTQRDPNAPRNLPPRAPDPTPKSKKAKTTHGP